MLERLAADIIFLDPPYELEREYEKVLTVLGSRKPGLVIAQHATRLRLAEEFGVLKRFRVVAEEWTQESGELTPSMKLKRRAITARYANEIAELYADEATARGESGR